MAPCWPPFRGPSNHTVHARHNIALANAFVTSRHRRGAARNAYRTSVAGKIGTAVIIYCHTEIATAFRRSPQCQSPILHPGLSD